MDLKAVASVVARHRRATLVGIALAFGVAFLAAFRIDVSLPPSLERRQATTYESTARLFVTQKGFPWGRSALQYSVSQGGAPPVVEGDPGRFAQLALLYAQLANSDAVRGNLSKEDKRDVAASVVTINQFSSDPLPLVDITAKATSPVRARQLATQATSSFLRFFRRSQQGSDIPIHQRIVLELINPPRLGAAASGPSPVLPVLVLLTGLLATVAGVFIFDNWRHGPAGQIADLTSAAPSAGRDEDAIEDDEPAIAIASAAGGRARLARSEPAVSASALATGGARSAGGGRARLGRPESGAPTLGDQRKRP